MELFRTTLWDMPLAASVNRRQWTEEHLAAGKKQVWLSDEGKRLAVSLFEQRKQENLEAPGAGLFPELCARDRTGDAVAGKRMERRGRAVRPHAPARMSERHWYIFSYDIRDAKRWRQVYRIVRGYGERLQYSLFRCRLTRAQMEQARHELERGDG